jgi:hypothetical protein
VVSLVAADAGGGNVANINTAADPVTWPTVAAKDIALVLWIMQNTVTPTIPAGWTVPGSGSFDGTSGASRYRLMWHLCDGTESGALSLTNTGPTANRQSATLVVYRGLDNTNPIDVLASPLQEAVSGTTHQPPAVTIGVANAPVATAIGERSTTGTNGWTPPSSPFGNERADSTTAATGSGGTIVAWADDGLAVTRSAGATVTPGVWTSGNAFATANVVTWTLSLNPAATGKNPQLTSQYGSYF